MTIDGIIVVPPEPNKAITAVKHNNTTIAFIVSSGSPWFSQMQSYIPYTYRLIEPGGDTIIRGDGILTFHETLELYSIQGVNHFSWLDIDANPIITIPFLSSTFD